MKKTVAACLAICAAWGTAFGLGIQANGDRSIAVTNASGTAVVTFTGLLPKFGPKAGGLPFDAVRKRMSTCHALSGGAQIPPKPASAPEGEPPKEPETPKTPANGAQKAAEAPSAAPANAPEPGTAGRKHAHSYEITFRAFSLSFDGSGSRSETPPAPPPADPEDLPPAPRPESA